MDEVQNPESAPATENAEDGSLDQAVEAMLKRQADAEPEAQQEEASDEDKPEPDEEEPPAEPETAEVEYEGKAYKVPPELKDALLRQADYTKKTQEVSARAKSVEAAEQRAEQMVAQSEALAEVLAEHKTVSAELKKLEGVNWAQLRAQDPSQYQLLAVDRQNLILEQQRIAERAKGVFGELQAKRSQAFAEKREAMLKQVAKDVPGWGDELGTSVTQYAVKEGFTPEEIQQWTDARLVKLADKARRYDELQAKKPDVMKKASAAAKPLTPGTQRPNTDAVKTSFDRLKRDGSLDAAADAMLAREQARRNQRR